MATIIQADIFFFITTIAVIILITIGSIVGYYLIKILRDLKELSAVLRQIAGKADEEADELWERLHKHSLFDLIFGWRSARRRSAGIIKKEE